MKPKDRPQNPFKESAKRFTKIRNQKPSPDEVRKIFEKDDASGKSGGESDGEKVARPKEVEI